MRLALFLVTATIVSFISSVGIIFFYEPAAPKTHAATISPVVQSELREYFDQKGIAERKSTASFADMSPEKTSLALVLAASDTSNIQPPTQSPKVHLADKPTYTIAVLGDSMVDTMGPGIPHLKQLLTEKFPGTSFIVLNYGAGSTDLEYGLHRLTNSFTYLDRPFAPLLANDPDLVVVESFAYNHWDNTPAQLDRQWLTIAKIIDTIKAHNENTQVMLATAIAPHCPTYTDGSANLPPERKFPECETVKSYLQNMVNFATSQDYPLANAYHASLAGTDGDPKYINQGDHIHPSDEGKALFAKKVVENIVVNSN